MSVDEIIQADFKRMSLINFWKASQEEYPKLSCKSVNFSLTSTATCVTMDFFQLVMIKMKYKNLRYAEAEIRWKVVKIASKIN